MTYPPMTAKAPKNPSAEVDAWFHAPEHPLNDAMRCEREVILDATVGRARCEMKEKKA